MRSVNLPLRVVFYYESDRWVAHCLEFDLLGDGGTQAEALDALSQAISLQIEASVKYANPQNLFTPAEGRYFHMFAKGKNVAVGKLHIHVDGYELDEVTAREYQVDEMDPEPATA